MLAWKIRAGHLSIGYLSLIHQFDVQNVGSQLERFGETGYRYRLGVYFW